MAREEIEESFERAEAYSGTGGTVIIASAKEMVMVIVFFFFQVYWKFLNFRIAISFWVQTPVKEKRAYNQTLLLLQKKRPTASSYVNLKAVISDWNRL